MILTTLGTGIGSAMLYNGVLIPNTELGHLEIDGHDAEKQASFAAKEREELSWKSWASRLQRYYSRVEALFSPALFVVGGGVSKESTEFLPLLDVEHPDRARRAPQQRRNSGRCVARIAPQVAEPACFGIFRHISVV